MHADGLGWKRKSWHPNGYIYTVPHTWYFFLVCNSVRISPLMSWIYFNGRNFNKAPPACKGIYVYVDAYTLLQLLTFFSNHVNNNQLKLKKIPTSFGMCMWIFMTAILSFLLLFCCNSIDFGVLIVHPSIPQGNS